MSKKESLFEKYKIVRDDGYEVENSDTEKVAEELPIEKTAIEVENPAETKEIPDESFEYEFKDSTEVDEIINLVLEKEDVETIPMETIPLTVAPLSAEEFHPVVETEENEFSEIKVGDFLDKEEEVDFEKPAEEPEIVSKEIVEEAVAEETETIPEEVLEESESVSENIVIEEVASEEVATEEETTAVAESVVEEKPKKQKKVKEPKPPKEKKEKGELAEPVTKKDYVTLILAVIAVVLALSFVVVKFFPNNNTPTVDGEETTIAEQDLANIQISREGSLRNYVQSDIPSVFYQFSSDYSLQYYQYRDNRMVPVQSTGTLSATVDFGPAKLPVSFNYVKVGGQIFGVGLFRPDQHPDIKLYNVKLVMFKLTNLPKGYASDGKALLLANVATAADLEKDVNMWTESYTVDLTSGKTSRFVSVGSRTIDSTTGAYVADFGVLTQEGYNATSGKIPFLSARYYEAGAGKDDVFIKDGTKESVAIKGIVNKKLIVDGNAVIFMRYTQTGFNVYRYENGKESLVLQFTGSTNRCVFADEYILDKEKGALYNLKTGKETLLVGYKMTSPELIKVSPDGRYLVVMGLMDNIMDYQVHIFDLQTGDVAKYLEDNYSNVNNLSKNLSFINNNTIMYMLPDPNRGRECVILDLSKAFK